MIECGSCGIQFSGNLAACPACEWTPELKDLRGAKVEEATELLDRGAKAKDIRNDLIGLGYSDIDADEMVAEASKTFRKRNRKLGGRRLAQGLAMIGLAFVGFLVTGGSIIFTGLIAFGFSFILIGLFQRLSGKGDNIV